MPVERRECPGGLHVYGSYRDLATFAFVIMMLKVLTLSCCRLDSPHANREAIGKRHPCFSLCVMHLFSIYTSTTRREGAP